MTWVCWSYPASFWVSKPGTYETTKVRLNYPLGSQCSHGTLLGLLPASTIATTNLLSPLCKHLANPGSTFSLGKLLPVKTPAWLTALVLSLRQELLTPVRAWASILDSSPLAMARWAGQHPAPQPRPEKGDAHTNLLSHWMYNGPSSRLQTVQFLYFTALKELQRKEAMQKLNKVGIDF